MIYGAKPIGTVAYLGGLMAVPEAFTWCWGQMIQYNTEYLCEPGQRIQYERATISFHAAARNDLVTRMRGNWLLQLDTDLTFEPDVVARLVAVLERNPDIHVVTGLYQHKGPPHSPVLYLAHEDGEHFVPLGKWEEREPPYLLPVASAGAGCLLVRRGVFDRMRDELHEAPFDILPPFGEDHSFFKRLKRLGLHAYCAPYIHAHHLQVRPVSMDAYETQDLTFSEPIRVGGES